MNSMQIKLCTATDKVHGLMYSFVIFYTEFVNHFKESTGAITLLASLFVGSMFCTGPLASVVINKFGPRLAIIIGSVLSSCCLFISTFASSIVLLYFTVGLGTGTGFCIIHVAGVVSVSDYIDKKRSLAIGIALSGSAIGLFVLGPIIGWKIGIHGWKSAMTFSAFLVICCIILSFVICPTKQRKILRNWINDEIAEVSIQAQNDGEDVTHRMPLLKEPVFVVFIISSFLTSFGILVPYMHTMAQAQRKGVLPDLFIYMLSASSISTTVGSLGLGYLFDKVNPLSLYNTCLTICGLSTVLSTFCITFAHFLLYTVIFGFTVAVYTGFTAIVLIHLLGLNRLTSAFGILLFFQGIAYLIGPLFIGWLSDLTSSYDVVFYVSGFMIAASGFMLYFINFLTKCCCCK